MTSGEQKVRHFYAHTRPGCAEASWEPLDVHLREVSELSARFAESFGGADIARLAGLWHDLGKYRDEFQRYLRTAGTSSESPATSTHLGRVDHSTAGAIHAISALGEKYGKLIAYLIAGHHAGLPDGEGGESALRSRLDRLELLEGALASVPPSSILQRESRLASRPPSGDAKDVHLWIRMLFSALVDADFLSTERFMAPDRSVKRVAGPSLGELLEPFEVFMAAKLREATGPLAELRSTILADCIAGASRPPGLFSLTVPTGGGKTLCSLAFALHHARAHASTHGHRRVIYVIPYTSILEQTAGVFREIFGDFVLEHHSNLASERDTERSRVASENWDSPIVLTTNVQFFESLFASRTSSCRKLHNIAQSVVILDEVQLLPPAFLDPIRQVIRLLSRDYGVTFVLSTATQPALDLENVYELMPSPEDLCQRLERVSVTWPSSDTPRSWEAIAQELAENERVLCIVNRRDDARELTRMLPADTIHLSALMCGEHRSRVIAQIRTALEGPGPVRVVATQLVEAGVDIDFPVVYRAYAGLDSIAQAAGRCNREGRLDSAGRVVVFHPPRPSPGGLLRKAESATRELAATVKLELSPALFLRYFDLLYHSKVNSLDQEGVLDLLGRDAHRLDIQFRTAAERFRLVDDSSYRPVLVTWKGGGRLVERLRKEGPSRDLLRLLQRFTVNLPERQLRGLIASGDVVESQDDFFVQQREALYDERLGLLTESPEYAPEELIVQPNPRGG